MRTRALASVIVSALLLGACATESAVDVPTTVAPTTSTVAPTTTTTTTVPVAATSLSPLAELVKPLGSAIYDPADHRDDYPAPVGITIPSIGVENAPVDPVGVEDNGDMEIPGADAVGWYRFGPKPGQDGSAVLAAHISFDREPGVFRYLVDVEVGDEVIVAYDDGTTATFEIVEMAQYDKQELPFDRVFAKAGEPVLTLITCGGEFNRTVRSYEDNIVAYAVPTS